MLQFYSESHLDLDHDPSYFDKLTLQHVQLSSCTDTQTDGHEDFTQQ